MTREFAPVLRPVVSVSVEDGTADRVPTAYTEGQRRALVGEAQRLASDPRLSPGLRRELDQVRARREPDVAECWED